MGNVNSWGEETKPLSALTEEAQKDLAGSLAERFWDRWTEDVADLGYEFDENEPEDVELVANDALWIRFLSTLASVESLREAAALRESEEG